MSQEWAIKKGLNPVLYIAGYSNVYHCIVNMAQWKYPVSADENKEENTDREYRHLLSFIKPLHGAIKVQGTARKKDFYQENEWRYVPFDKNIEDYLKKEEFEDRVVRERNNAITKQLCSLSNFQSMTLNI